MSRHRPPDTAKKQGVRLAAAISLMALLCDERSRLAMSESGAEADAPAYGFMGFGPTLASASQRLMRHGTHNVLSRLVFPLPLVRHLRQQIVLGPRQVGHITTNWGFT